MRIMVAFAIVTSLALSLAVPAEAQTRLPRTSPAERNTNEINRRIQQDQKILGVEQECRPGSPFRSPVPPSDAAHRMCARGGLLVAGARGR